MSSAALDIRAYPECTVIAVQGDVDSANAAALSSAIERAADAHGRTILDLNDLDYFDSAGIHLVFGLARRLAEHGGELILAAHPTSVAGATLRYANASGVLASADSVQAAREAPR